MLEHGGRRGAARHRLAAAGARGPGGRRDGRDFIRAHRLRWPGCAGLVERDRRTGPGARQRPVPRARHRFSGWQPRQQRTGAGRALSEREQLRPGVDPAARARPLRRSRARRLHRRLVRRDGGACLCRALSRPAAAGGGDQRGAPHAPDVDRLAQRAAGYRPLRPGAGGGAARPRAGEGACDGHLPVGARIRGALCRRGRARRGWLPVSCRVVSACARGRLRQPLSTRILRLPVGVDRSASHRSGGRSVCPRRWSR